MTAQSLFEKVWQRHVVVPETADTPAILYSDLHLTHEVTSPQAFDVLRARKLKVRRLDRTLATMLDHSAIELLAGGVKNRLVVWKDDSASTSPPCAMTLVLATFISSGDWGGGASLGLVAKAGSSQRPAALSATNFGVCTKRPSCVMPWLLKA